MSELLQVPASSCSGEGAQQQGVGDAGGCLSVVRTNQKYSSKEQRITAAIICKYYECYITKVSYNILTVLYNMQYTVF